VRRTLLAFAIGTALLAGTRAAHACLDDAGPGGGACNTDDAGACATNEYCALPDGGAILDGAPGVCQLEPCVCASDCQNPTFPICDTSQNPFQCVECISTSDCPGILVCDIANHTCVNPPPVPDASADASGSTDGAIEDGASTEGGEAGGPSSGDAASNSDGASGSDASGTTDGSSSGPPADASPGEGGLGSADTGSLGGGAWDCELASPARGPFAALGVTFAFALLLFARKRSRRG
jgi:hypothetical protein